MKPRSQVKNAAWLEKLYEEGKIKNNPKALQEPPPPLFPDLYWVWEAYCFLSERRMLGSNGPMPISVSDMQAYTELTGRDEEIYKRQIIRFVPPLDRIYLKDFYDRQSAEMEKNAKKAKTPRGGR